MKIVNSSGGLTADRGAVRWELRLYVAGQTAHSVNAMANLKILCEAHLRVNYTIEVIDLLVQPERSGEDDILAIPTLVRRFPEPVRKVIGDLSDGEQVILWLEFRAQDAAQVAGDG